MFHNLKSQRTLDNSTLNRTIIDKLTVMSKNILYITHAVDRLDNELSIFRHDLDLLHQVQLHYSETSPQTDSETNDDTTSSD